MSLLQSLSELNLNFEELGNSVFIVYDFFSEKDLEPLWNIIKSATQEDWEKDYRESQIWLAEKKFGRSDLDNLIAEGLVEYTTDWSDKAISVPEGTVNKTNARIKKIFWNRPDLKTSGITTIQRQYENSPLVEHVDSDGDPSVAYAIIGYMNDDYTGGELFFRNLNLEIKPPAKSLIIFPSGEEYLHGVRTPGPGPIRYALPTFSVYSDFFDKIE
jgi:hypothetical protein